MGSGLGPVRALGATTLVVGLLAACGTPREPAVEPEPGDEPMPAEADPADDAAEPGVELAADVARAEPGDAQVADLVAGMTSFGERLMDEAAEPESNAVVSPVSIAMAFAMARAGAEGATAAEIDEVFGFDDDQQVTHASFNALGRVLDDAAPGDLDDVDPDAARNADGRGDPPVLAIANGVLPQHDLVIHDAYLQTLGEHYGAGVMPVDFSAPDEAKALVDGWVGQHTGGRIDELFAEIDPRTVLILANAIYLKADWQYPFTDHPVRDRGFTTATGDEVRVPTMDQLLERVRYAEDDAWQAVELPYEGDGLAMWVIVPTDGHSPADVRTADTLTAVGDGLSEGVVKLHLPQWDSDTDVELIPALEALGMHAPFTGADFSGITDTDMWIGGALHRATITVDEQGTEAAAVTGLAMEESAPPGPDVTIRADRPFVFAIVDTTHHAPVFLGQVADPSV